MAVNGRVRLGGETAQGVVWGVHGAEDQVGVQVDSAALVMSEPDYRNVGLPLL